MIRKPVCIALALAVTQPAGETFRPGDRVRVISDGRCARVTQSATGDK